MQPDLAPVRVPLTGSRGDLSFAKILRHIRNPPHSGFDFHGFHTVPGKLVTLAELSPPGYPRVPVLLECAGICKPGRGQVKSEMLYLVWTYDPPRNDWIELGRARSTSWDWAFHLAPIAHRAIERQLPPPDLALTAERIRRLLDAELERVPPDGQARILSIIHDEFAVRAAAGGWAGCPLPPAYPLHQQTH